jgi:hypothetical protein
MDDYDYGDYLMMKAQYAMPFIRRGESDRDGEADMKQDLENHGFTEDEIEAIIGNDITVKNPKIWTKFVAYYLMRIEPYDSYGKMINLLEYTTGKRYVKNTMPSTIGGDDRPELLVLTFEMSKTLD